MRDKPTAVSDQSKAQSTKSKVSRRSLVMTSAAALSLAGCARIESLLTPKEPPLPGKRLSILENTNALDGLNARAVQNPNISLGPPLANTEWAQQGSGPARVASHVAFADKPRRVWSLKAGTGNRRRHKLTSGPIIVNKTIFFLDSSGNVSARRLDDGRQYWERSVWPQGEKSGFGGALAYADGRLHVSAGLDYIVTLDARTGKALWYQRLKSPVRSAPAVVEGRVYLITLNNQIYCLDAATGGLVWTNNNQSTTTRLLGGSGLATDGTTVVAALGNGDIQGLSADKGRLRWEESLAQSGIVDSAMGEIPDIAAPPAIHNGNVYITTHTGRTASLDLGTGRLNWDASFGARNAMAFSPNHGFLLTSEAKLIAIDLASGAEIWIKELPRYAFEPTRRGFIAYHGPVLAGNRLFFGAENRKLITANPLTGQVLSDVDLTSAVVSAPIVANGTMLIPTKDGYLHAFR